MIRRRLSTSGADEMRKLGSHKAVGGIDGRRVDTKERDRERDREDRQRNASETLCFKCKDSFILNSVFFSFEHRS